MLTSPDQLRLNDIIVDGDLALRRIVAIRFPRQSHETHQIRTVPWKGVGENGKIILEGEESTLVYYSPIEVIGNADSTPTSTTPPIMHDVPADEIIDHCIKRLQEIVDKAR